MPIVNANMGRWRKLDTPPPVTRCVVLGRDEPCPRCQGHVVEDHTITFPWWEFKEAICCVNCGWCGDRWLGETKPIGGV